MSEGSGAAEGIRTPDPIITNDVLYQLSYRGPRAGLGLEEAAILPREAARVGWAA